jgi:hypothetical protein
LDGGDHKSYFYANSTRYVYNDSMLFSFSDTELRSVINYKRDSTLNVQLLNKYPEMENKVKEDFKVFIQTYNQTLINNSGSLK